MTPPPASDRHYVSGTRFRDEAYVYLRYVLALAKPGVRVPVFGRSTQSEHSLTSKDDGEQDLLLDEARAQLARQSETMQYNQTRAATLLTVTVAELVYLVKVASNILKRGDPAVITLWGLALMLALLALAGTVAVLTTSAEFGAVNLGQVIDSDEPVRVELAARYANALGVGDLTNATRITVLRDAVWLAVMAGLALVATVPFSSDQSEDKACRVPTGYACVITIARPTSSSSSPAMPTTAPASPSATARANPTASASAAVTPAPSPRPVVSVGATPVVTARP